MLTEQSAKLQKLLGISCKTGEFGKDEALMWPRFTSAIIRLASAFSHDGFSRNAGQIIQLNHRPLVELGVFAGALSWCCGSLLWPDLQWKPNPDADALFKALCSFYILFHTRKRRLTARESVADHIHLLRFHHVTEATLNENDLALLAKTFRRQAHTTRAQAAGI